MSRLLKLPNVNTISAMVFHLGSGPNFRYAYTDHINRSFLEQAYVHAQATFVKLSYSASAPLFTSAANVRKYRDNLRYDYLNMTRTSLAHPHVSPLPRFFFFSKRYKRYSKINGTIYQQASYKRSERIRLQKYHNRLFVWHSCVRSWSSTASRDTIRKI